MAGKRIEQLDATTSLAANDVFPLVKSGETEAKHITASNMKAFLTQDTNVPAGGTTGQTLKKASNTDFDTEWDDSGIPADGTVGQVLVKDSSTPYDTRRGDPATEFDKRVAITADDTTSDCANEKIVGGAGIETDVLNPAGDEQLSIRINTDDPDIFMKSPIYIYSSAYLTGGTSAETSLLIRDSYTDGEFAISIDGVSYDVTGCDFTDVTTMDDVADIIQTQLRLQTGGLETVVWSTNHFIISSVNTTFSSAITVTSAVVDGIGTDISGATTTICTFMDSNTGNGTVTNKAIVGIDSEDKVPVSDAEGYIHKFFVNGACNRVEAGEDVIQNNLLAMESDGKVYKTNRFLSAIASAGTITGIDIDTTYNMIEVEYLTSDKAIMCYKKSADNKVYGTVVSFDRETPTFGTEVAIISTNVPDNNIGFRLSALSPTLFVVIANKKSSASVYAVACTVSGTTITAGGETEATNDGDEIVSALSKVSSTKFMIGYKSNGNNDMYVRAGSISGTTITMGTAENAGGDSCNSGFLCYISNDSVGLVQSENSPSAATFYKTLSVSGTSITVGSEVEISSSYTSYDNHIIRLISGGGGLVLCVRPNALNIAVDFIDIYSNTLVGTTYLSGAAGETSKVNARYLGNGRISVSSINGGYIRTQILEVMPFGFKTIYEGMVAGNGVSVSCGGLDTIGEKVLIIYNETTSTDLKYTLYRNTEDRYIGVATETITEGNDVIAQHMGKYTTTGLTIGRCFVGDNGAIATTGNKQIGMAESTTSLLLK